MSLVITTYVPEGVVMASDSRQSVTVEGKKPDGEEFKIETINSDSVQKTFLLAEQRVGISNFGQDLLKGIPMVGHIKRFEEEDIVKADDVETVANKIVKYFKKEFGGVDVGFHVCGYKKEGKLSIPYVFYCHVGKNLVERRNQKPGGGIAYGATWSGQSDVLSAILKPHTIVGGDGKPTPTISAPIIWDAMTLQDAIDFSIFAIRTTIDLIRFQARPKNVGGNIDVLAITPDEVHWIQKKELYGEQKSGL